MEETKKPSSSSPPPYPSSFSSLPYDVVLNILARLSIFQHPTLSLVCKTFRYLIASHELKATLTGLGKTNVECLYVCLSLNKKYPEPRWFMLAPFTKHEKLVPVPLFHQLYTKSSTAVSHGSKIYIIGDEKRSKRVLLLDCENHHWLLLPNMIIGRKSPAVDVINGKIYVIGGCNEGWGEVYDPETRIWEPKIVDLGAQKRVFPGGLVMGGKFYDMHFERRWKSLLVEVEKKVFYRLVVCNGKLLWLGLQKKGHLAHWSKVLGLEEGLPSDSIYPVSLISVAYSSEERIGRVSVWWKAAKFGRQCRCDAVGCKTVIWCAEVALERRNGFEEIWGFVEWSKDVLTVDGCDSGSDFLLDSVIVTKPASKIQPPNQS